MIMIVHEKKLFDVMSVDEESKAAMAVSLKSSSKSDVIKTHRSLNKNYEEKIIVSLLVGAGLTVWTIAVFFMNPKQSIKDVVSIFRRNQ